MKRTHDGKCKIVERGGDVEAFKEDGVLPAVSMNYKYMHERRKVAVKDRKTNGWS